MVSASIHSVGVPLTVTVEHVNGHDGMEHYYRLRLSDDPRSTFVAFLEPAQLIQIHDAIRDAYVPVESDESYQASEALQTFRVSARPVTPSAPEFVPNGAVLNRGPVSDFDEATTR